MYITIDERECFLYDKCVSLEPQKHIISKSVLTLGDIVFKCLKATDEANTVETFDELIIIERKSIQDLLASIQDGRYNEQSHRLIHASRLPRHRIIYIIEGMMSTVSTREKKDLVYATITSLNQFKGFSVLRTCSCQETAELLLAMATKIDREFAKKNVLYIGETKSSTIVENTSIADYHTVVKRVKKENLTPENMMLVMIAQIPGISSVISKVIYYKYPSLPVLIHVIERDRHALDGLQYEYNGKMRKVSSAAIRSICDFLVPFQEESAESIALSEPGASGNG